MRAIYLGDVVLQRRKSLDLTQEMVCEGLCSTMTLSRFEGNKQTPSRDLVTAILQRLGLPDDQYYAHLTRKETKLVRLRKEIRAYCNQFEHTTGEERQQICTYALEKLQSLERCVKENDCINQQFILMARVTLDLYPLQNQLEMLMKSIRLTSPRFNLDELDTCLYHENEILGINQIAIRYALCEQFGKAFDIFGQLLTLVQKRTPNHSSLPLITYNYALYLASEGRLEEALKISGIGQKSCIAQGYYEMFPKLLHIDAGCYYILGESDKSLNLFRSAYHIYGVTRDVRSQQISAANVKGCFNLTL